MCLIAVIFAVQLTPITPGLLAQTRIARWPVQDCSWIPRLWVACMLWLRRCVLSCCLDTQSCSVVRSAWSVRWRCCPSSHCTRCRRCAATCWPRCCIRRLGCAFRRCCRAQLGEVGCSCFCIHLRCLSRVSNASIFSRARIEPGGGHKWHTVKAGVRNEDGCSVSGMLQSPRKSVKLYILDLIQWMFSSSAKYLPSSPSDRFFPSCMLNSVSFL